MRSTKTCNDVVGRKYVVARRLNKRSYFNVGFLAGRGVVVIIKLS